MDHIQSAALSKNSEVSLAALKSCQEILQIVTPVKECEKPEGLSGVNMLPFVGPLIPPGPPRVLSRSDSMGERLGRYTVGELNVAGDEIEDSALWWAAWNTWYKIGSESTKPPATCDKLFFIPSQPFLTALVQIFPALYQHIKSGFSMEDLKRLGVILHGAVSVPISSDASPFILPSYTEAVLTSLQEAVLIALDVLQKVNTHNIPSSATILLEYNYIVTKSVLDYKSGGTSSNPTAPLITRKLLKQNVINLYNRESFALV